MCAENQRLRDGSHQLVLDNKEITHRLGLADDEIVKLNYTIKELVDKEQSFIGQIKTLEENVTILTQQVESLMWERDQVANYSQSIAQESEHAWALSQNIEATWEEAQRRCAQLESDNMRLDWTLNQTTQEKMALERQIDFE